MTYMKMYKDIWTYMQIYDGTSGMRGYMEICGADKVYGIHWICRIYVGFI